MDELAEPHTGVNLAKVSKPGENRLNCCRYVKSTLMRVSTGADHSPGSGSVVTWRRAQMVLLSAEGMDMAAIAKVALTRTSRSGM